MTYTALRTRVWNFVSEDGMINITQSLYELAKRNGIVFNFNSLVEKINLTNNRVKGTRRQKLC